jgi:hypothetical protein
MGMILTYKRLAREDQWEHIKKILIKLDMFKEKHSKIEGEPVVPKGKVLGGLFTMCALLLMGSVTAVNLLILYKVYVAPAEDCEAHAVLLVQHTGIASSCTCGHISQGADRA